MMPETETEELRRRIRAFVARLEHSFPKRKVARALVADACNVLLADQGAMATLWMTEGATNLLAGHWSAETIKTFIEREH